MILSFVIITQITFFTCIFVLLSYSSGIKLSDQVTLIRYSSTFVLFPQDCPESPLHLDHPPELHLSNILHHPTPVLSAGAHSRLSAATPTQSFSPFRPYTPTSAIKAHVQSPAPIRFISPSLGQISFNRTMSPAVGE